MSFCSVGLLIFARGLQMSGNVKARSWQLAAALADADTKVCLSAALQRRRLACIQIASARSWQRSLCLTSRQVCCQPLDAIGHPP